MPASSATSSRRRPGVRRRGPATSPTSCGRSRSRERRRKAASSVRVTAQACRAIGGAPYDPGSQPGRYAGDRRAIGHAEVKTEKGVSAMSKAVRFSEYGGIDVLEVVDVERPVPGNGQVLVQVRAAAINPGE